VSMPVGVARRSGLAEAKLGLPAFGRSGTRSVNDCISGTCFKSASRISVVSRTAVAGGPNREVTGPTQHRVSSGGHYVASPYGDCIRLAHV
jgi:hypothetical protein